MDIHTRAADQIDQKVEERWREYREVYLPLESLSSDQLLGVVCGEDVPIGKGSIVDFNHKDRRESKPNIDQALSITFDSSSLCLLLSLLSIGPSSVIEDKFTIPLNSITL